MTAPQLAELVGRLEEGDEDIGRLLDRLVRRAPELVPGCSAAALPLSGTEGGEIAAFPDPRVETCHAVQFRGRDLGHALDAGSTMRGRA